MMNRLPLIFCTVLVMTATTSWVGCNNKPTEETAHEGEHHAGDGHDHAAGGHPTKGPHQGHLIDLGEEEYHAELTHDEATKTVTIYLLDKAAQTAVPIAETELLLNLVADGKPLQAKLVAAPLDTDPAGQASRFTIVDEAVLESLESPKTTGRLNVTIGGKPYSGVVEFHEHGDHQH